MVIKETPRKGPKTYQASDLETGSVYLVLGTEKTYVMKARVAGGHNVINLSTGIFVESPHLYTYELLHAELVVQRR